MIEETKISAAIIEAYTEKFKSALNSDVLIVGGGPSGLLAAGQLAESGYKVTLIERKLAFGGGIWGGGMLMNLVVLQEEILPVIDKLSLNYKPWKDGLYIIDSAEFVAGLILYASKSGATLLNCVSAEDVMYQNGKFCGLVVQWTPVQMASLHVDPLCIRSKAILDATGHPAEICNIAIKKIKITVPTPDGTPQIEKGMWAEVGEVFTVEKTSMIAPGLFVSGMAANNIYGGPRMGPIFGGMLKSGIKVAKLIEDYIKKA